VLAFSDLDPDENAFVKDGLNDAPGVRVFQVLEDPRQPRVRALQIETAGGGTFTLTLDAKVAMALASALISVALTLDPTLKETLVEHSPLRLLRHLKKKTMRIFGTDLFAALTVVSAAGGEEPVELKKAPGIDQVEANCGACRPLGRA